MSWEDTISVPARTPEDELRETVRELIVAFGRVRVAQAIEDAGLMAATQAADQQQQMLRRYTLLIIEAKHPRAVAQVVGRLCYLDTASGTPLRQEDIARSIGRTKQAVCNMEADIAAQLGLPRRSSPKARQSHRLMNKRNYAYQPPQP